MSTSPNATTSSPTSLQGPPRAREVLRLSVTPELVQALQDVYPSKLPENPEDDVSIARKIGQQDVVRTLQAALREQDRRAAGGGSSTAGGLQQAFR